MVGLFIARSVDYVALLVDVWLFMVLPTVFALTKSILPVSQGGTFTKQYMYHAIARTFVQCDSSSELRACMGGREPVACLEELSTPWAIRVTAGQT